MAKIVHVVMCPGGRHGSPWGIILGALAGTGLLAAIWWVCMAMGRGWWIAIGSVAGIGVTVMVLLILAGAREDYRAVAARDTRPPPARAELSAGSHVQAVIPAQRTELPDNVVPFRPRSIA